MSTQAALEFLASQELISLSTASLDGAPHSAPMFFAIAGHNVIFTGSDKSRTGRNLSANARAAVSCGDAPDPGQTWDDAQGIQIVGTVVELSGDDATDAAGLLQARYHHLDDRIMQSHFYRLVPSTIEYIRNQPDGDEEFEALGVDWHREVLSEG
jgi:nitroimidazol reductase NimA-like FMN-containing flavoprotein (pyridoxamine 5'-phosphate oxidase superfamily)